MTGAVEREQIDVVLHDAGIQRRHLELIVGVACVGQRCEDLLGPPREVEVSPDGWT
jgi:hypothetical protein